VTSRLVPFENDREFLAAGAGQKHILAQRAFHHRGDDAQHPVADRVAIGVVEFLEVVDIGDDQGVIHRARLSL
jgi:hypothetical protein